MTTRELAIASAILEAMHAMDGGQADELVIHADATLRFRASIPLNEFNEVFGQLNALGCFIGVKNKFKGTRWSLADKGEQIRQEMR